MVPQFKKYFEFYDEISENDLVVGLLGHGMFADRLPPIFTSMPLLDYYMRHQPYTRVDKAMDYIRYENMRHTNTPRLFGIPTPMTYCDLVYELACNWKHIKQHMREKTSLNTHKVSRIHIRKMHDNDALFEMNYSNWKIDGSPVPDLMLGNNYQVKADISNCFPSIYSHALPWALVGKDTAKKYKTNTRKWYNKLDKRTRNLKNSETQGILIGPHVSNILSEIILTEIDSKLSAKWFYVRNIDDYTCYVESDEKAQSFLAELSSELREYNLSLNHKKTSILPLPLPFENTKISRLKSFQLMSDFHMVKYPEARRFIDLAISMIEEADIDVSILKYAIKVLAGKRLTDNAQHYVVQLFLHLALKYTYLVPLLDEYLFIKYDVQVVDIQNFANKLYKIGGKTLNYEAQCYAFYYAIKYAFELDIPDYSQRVLASKDCILTLLAYLYSKKCEDSVAQNQFINFAKTLSGADFEKNWLFAYELLDENDLSEVHWKNLKHEGVTFLRGV